MFYYLLAAHPDLAYPDVGSRDMINNPLVRIGEKFGLPVLSSERIYERFLPARGETKYDEKLHFLGLDPALPQEGTSTFWGDLIYRLGMSNFKDFTFDDHKNHPAFAARLRKRYRSLLLRTGKHRFLDKDPMCTIWLRILKDIFPDAFVVHLIRDGRAVVNSVASRFKTKLRGGTAWTPPTFWDPKPRNAEHVEEKGIIERACYQWREVVTQGRAEGRELFGEKYREIKYEEVAGNTRDVIADLFDFLQLEPFGQDLYPETMDNRNYKWQQPEGTTSEDPIWTTTVAESESEQENFAIIRPLLEDLVYVNTGSAD